MEKSPSNRVRTSTVALVRWSRKPGESPAVKFVMFSIFGVVLCLVLMMFIPSLRSAGAVVLFTVCFAALLTVPTVSGRRKFMQGLTKRVNGTLAEVTHSPDGQLSVKEFQRMVKTGERRLLLVSGVPGLGLHVERMATQEKDGNTTWVAVFSVLPPESGTDSFDRLVAAALQEGRGAGNAS
ncbi:hypothetical protein [Arthrobacter sp. EPSL27]|uniref:hypothetical protein n=1 Tax=Arthrobacter sp. EPSL27 TaxID=1745378 RepID=UPI000746CCD4|nr:hypothetical protein [Arthrobacter sp. EPSL27]KUM32900.1 hypothetical protein AR539_12920 [Arthrobacter sp. EPSL27]